MLHLFDQSVRIQLFPHVNFSKKAFSQNTTARQSYLHNSNLGVKEKSLLYVLAEQVRRTRFSSLTGAYA